MEYSINGSFVILQYNEEVLWVKRADNDLYELVGGGEDRNEFNHRGALVREIREEIGRKVKQHKLRLCAMLGQRLTRAASEMFGNTEYGSIFLYYCNLYGSRKPRITLSKDHAAYNFFSYKEIMANWEKFSSGSLWMYFTFLAFQETREVQEGLLKDRKKWRGKEYLYIPPPK